MSDHRRCHRLPIQLPAEINVAGTKKTVTTATTINIGATGVCIMSKEKCAVDDQLEVHLTLPIDDKITLNTMVIWVQPGDSGEYKLGLKILEPMTPDEKKFVQFYASRLLEVAAE